MAEQGAGRTTTFGDGPPAGSGADPIQAPPKGYPGIRPALFVAGLAVVLVVVFAVGELLTSRPGHQVQPRAPGATAVRGSPLLAVPANHLLAPILQPGEPPPDIVNAVVLPQGVTALSHRNNAGADQFDAQMDFHSAANQGALVGFFRATMARDGWRIFSTGPAFHLPGGVEVLGQKAGSDGWYWQMGAIVAPTTFTKGSTGDATRLTVRLFQVPDEQ
jgi:hypothetical protein